MKYSHRSFTERVVGFAVVFAFMVAPEISGQRSLAGSPLAEDSPKHAVSRPVGFVRVDVPADGRVAASVPFQPFDPGIASVFDRQLVGPTNISGSYRVYQWDRVAQKYVSATKTHGSDKPWLDGTWLDDADRESASCVTILPGQAFFIEAHSDQARNAFLWGEVVLDESFEQVFFPGINLFGNPFPASISLDHSGLPFSGDPETADSILLPSDPVVEALLLTGRPVSPVLAALQPGSGYWYRRKADEQVTWKEPRPYADVFPTGGPPRVIDMHVNESGEEIGLVIECTGVEGETLAVLYKDLAPGNALDITSGWQLADIVPSGEWANRAVCEEQGVLPRVCWRDGGVGLGRWQRVNEVFGRCYLVVRADLDADKDSLADGLETFVHGTDPKNPDTDEDGMPDGYELAHGLNPKVNDASQDLDKDGTCNLEEFKAGTDPRYARNGGLTIYVDMAQGNDANDGFALTASGGHGPKKTINAGLRHAVPGDRVLVLGGTYPEGHVEVPNGVTLLSRGLVRVENKPADMQEDGDK